MAAEDDKGNVAESALSQDPPLTDKVGDDAEGEGEGEGESETGAEAEAAKDHPPTDKGGDTAEADEAAQNPPPTDKGGDDDEAEAAKEPTSTDEGGEDSEVETNEASQDSPPTNNGGDDEEADADADADAGVSTEDQDTTNLDGEKKNDGNGNGNKRSRTGGNLHLSVRPSSGQKKDARAEWKKGMKLVKTNMLIPQSAVGKVKMENKIGKRASTLDDGDDMKVISLAMERAMRDFGKRDAAERRKVDIGEGMEVVEAGDDGEVEIRARMEGKFLTADMLSYEEEKEGSSAYRVPQPAFRCAKICDSDFSKVRAAFGISERQYYATFGLQESRSESDFYVISSKDASGKSSSFFFLSPDQRFILKSCTAKDVKTLVHLAKAYRTYVVSCKGEGKSTTALGLRTADSQTLLPRYLGLYGLEFDDPDVPDVVVVAMTNFFGGVYEIHRKFDLKGSTYKRVASEKERAKKSPVYKDLDWMKEGRRLRFPTREQMQAVRNQLHKDTKFLSHNGLIDYSLLVGIHEIDKSNLEKYQKREALRVISVRSGDETISYFGLVDVLTPYGSKKRAETIFMGNIVCCRDISCQRPPVYQKRFMQFCDEELLACDEKDEYEA